MAVKKTKTTAKKKNKVKKTPAKSTAKKKKAGVRTSSARKKTTKKIISKAPVYALVIMAITAGTFLLLNHYRTKEKAADSVKTTKIEDSKTEGKTASQKEKTFLRQEIPRYLSVISRCKRQN